MLLNYGAGEDLESPLDNKEFKPVNPNGNQPSVFIVKKNITFGLPSLVAQTVKNLPAMQETQVQSLGREDSLEKGMATHSTILAWRFHGLWWATVHGVAKIRTRLSD